MEMWDTPAYHARCSYILRPDQCSGRVTALGNYAEWGLRRMGNERSSTPESSQTPGLSMGGRLFTPNPR